MSKRAGCLLLVVFACGAHALASGSEEQAAPAGGGLTLQEAIRMAIARAPEISIAESGVARAGEALRETRASNRPQVIAGTGLAYNNGFPLSIEGAAPSAFQIGLSQPLFNRRNKNLILAAEEGIKASQIVPESIRNELAARTALIYFELHQARKLEELWAARQEAAAKELQQVETMLEAGKARPVEVTLARTAIAGAGQQLLVTREQARLAETELCELTGHALGDSIRTVEPKLDPQPLSVPGEVLYQKAIEAHPEIRQAESDLKSREFRVEAEKSGKYPRFELVTQYALFTRFNNYEDFFRTFTRNNFLVGMSIQVPLFDGSLTSARVAQSRQEVSEARLRLVRLKRDLKMNIERGVSALRIARGAADLASREQEAVEEVVRLNQTLLEGGRIAPKELLASQNQLREKKIAVLEAEKTTFQRQIELLRLTGGFAALY